VLGLPGEEIDLADVAMLFYAGNHCNRQWDEMGATMKRVMQADAHSDAWEALDAEFMGSLHAKKPRLMGELNKLEKGSLNVEVAHPWVCAACRGHKGTSETCGCSPHR
jgi:hypothetical protein